MCHLIELLAGLRFEISRPSRFRFLFPKVAGVWSGTRGGSWLACSCQPVVLEREWRRPLVRRGKLPGICLLLV